MQQLHGGAPTANLGLPSKLGVHLATVAYSPGFDTNSTILPEHEYVGGSIYVCPFSHSNF